MSQGSPPFSLSLIDWYSIGWTLATAALAAAFTALVDSVLPDLKEKGLIDATLFTLLTTLLHAARKFVTDSRMIRVLVAMAALGCLGSTGLADEIAVMLDGSRPGSYLVTVAADGTVTANPIRVVRPGQTPAPPPPNSPTPAPPFMAEIERLTKSSLSAGGTKTTAAALSSVYSLVSDEVFKGSIAVDKALPAVAAATNTILATQADRDAWGAWRTAVSGALTTLAQQGSLATKDQYAQVLKEISLGIDRATGFSFEPRDVPLHPTTAAAMEEIVATLKADRQLGILDGINLAQLIELIKLVMELLKLFGA
jgi:hypothetical protein